MNTVVTSKEEIMRACREIVSEEGLSAVSMRAVAKRCGVALGSLYNYFSNKDELVLKTVESVWQDIFHMDRSCETERSFLKTVTWIFESVQNGAREYPNFFTAHSLSIASDEKVRAKSTMAACLGHMKAGMAAALRADPTVRKDAFSEDFPEADFLDFVLNSILLLLLKQEKDCRVLLEMIRRAVC